MPTFFKRFTNDIGREHRWSEKVSLNGNQFRYEVASASPQSVRFPKEGVELNLLIDAIGPTTDVPTSIDNLKPTGRLATPDFSLHFGDRVVYCECTSAGDSQSFTWQLTLGDWQNRLVSAIDERPEIGKNLDGRYLAFIPTRMPSTNDIDDLVSEGVRFIENEDLSTFGAKSFGVKIPDSYPKLHNLQTTIASSTSNYSHTFIQMPAMSIGGPRSALQDILKAFDRKRKQKYSLYSPVWLVIGATNVLWPLDKIVSDFVERTDTLIPFERVYICTSRESFRIVNGSNV